MPSGTLLPPSQTNCRVEFVRYGMLTLYAFTKSNINIQSVLADDGYAVKYMRCTFECDMIITNETCSITPNDVSDRTYAGTDTWMDTAKLILGTQGHPFEISFRGSGRRLNFLSMSGQDNQEGSGIPALLNGPTPEVISWEPLGNLAAKCRWRVVVTYLPVQPINSFERNIEEFLYGLYPFPNTNPQLFEKLVSITEEQDVSINESGAVVLTTIGTLEFAGNRKIAEEVRDRNGEPVGIQVDFPDITRETIRALTHMFRTLVPIGFHRTQKYRYNKNHRSISYVITDTEIESDNPLHPFIIEADVTHSLASDTGSSEDVFKGQGLLTWNAQMEGTFTIRPGVWKGWAWVAMAIILYQRLNRSAKLEERKLRKALDERDYKDTDSQPTPDTAIIPGYLITHIDIKEWLYKRQVKINVEYLLLASLDQLITASGMFSPVDTSWVGMPYGKVPQNSNSPRSTTNPGAVPQPAHLQWRLWACNTQVYQNIKGYRDVNMPKLSLIFSPIDESPTRLTASQMAVSRQTSNYPVTNFIKEMPRTREIDESIQDPDDIPGLTCYINTQSNGADASIQGEDGSESLFKGRGERDDDYTGSSPGKEQSAYFNRLDPKRSFIRSHLAFEVIEDTHSIYMAKVESQPRENMRDSSKDAASRNNIGLNIHGSDKTEVTPYDLNPQQSFAKPTYQVRMTGYTVRAGWAAPVPVLLGVHYNEGSETSESGGPTKVLAYRVGKNRTKHLQVAQSADIPIYLTMWDVTYALDGDPRCTDLRFDSNTPSEYA